MRDEPRSSTLTQLGQPAHSHCDLILALPEARERPRAAAAIAAFDNSISLSSATAVLRGLPTETKEAAVAITAHEQARFNRGLDLRCAALRAASSNESDKASAELTKINKARNIIALTGCSWGTAFTNAGIEARGIITAIVKNSF